LVVDIDGEVDSVEGEDLALLVGDDPDLAASAVSELPQASAGSSFLDEESAFEGSTGGLAGPHAGRQRIEQRTQPLIESVYHAMARLVRRFDGKARLARRPSSLKFVV
jgi:hypothetical protein